MCAVSGLSKQAGRQAGKGERRVRSEGDKDQLRSPDGKWIAQCERRVERGRCREGGAQAERKVEIDSRRERTRE